jgi:putative transposase
MARLPRLSLPSYPHHVIQRGNNRQPIFFAPKDYEVFLDCRREAKRKCQARLYAYVLMTNHVHLLVEPAQEGDLGRFMQSVGRRYVRYINHCHVRTGTLWEGRFKSALVDQDEYLIMCSRYIELNPIRAGMVHHLCEYRWSSYHGRALGQPDPLLDEDPWYVTLGDSPQLRAAAYANWLETSVSDHEWERIRTATQQGRVVGSDAFQEEIGAQAGRRLNGETRGRPKGRGRPEIVL